MPSSCAATSTAPSRRRRAASRGAGDALAARQRAHVVHGRQRIERRRDGLRRRARADRGARRRPARSTSSASSSSRCSTRIGSELAAASGRGRRPPPRPTRRPATRPAARCVHDERTRHEAPAELLEHDHRVGAAEPDAALALGAGAARTRRAPRARSRARGRSRRARELVRAPRAAARPSQKERTPSLRAPLVFVEPEVHLSLRSARSAASGPSAGRGCARR